MCVQIRLAVLGAAAAMLLGAAACGGDDDTAETPTPTPVRLATGTSTASPEPTAIPTPSPTSVPASPQGNLLVNPGFEEGSEPWISLNPETSFELSQEAAFTGENSAVLHLDAPAGTVGSQVQYLVQEVSPGRFPETLRGAYRVLNWVKGSPKQYLQVVVIAIGADNNPVPAENFQIRYILAGVSEPPLEIGNARYLFFSEEEPITGQWLAFETNVRNDFLSTWGVVPEGFDKIRVLFEVRYDDRMATDVAGHADVWYDDLYVGSAQ